MFVNENAHRRPGRWNGIGIDRYAIRSTIETIFVRRPHVTVSRGCVVRSNNDHVTLARYPTPDQTTLLNVFFCPLNILNCFNWRLHGPGAYWTFSVNLRTTIRFGVKSYWKLKRIGCSLWRGFEIGGFGTINRAFSYGK